MSKQKKQPPQAPEIERRLMLYPYQWVAIPLLMVIPVLALLGVFGQTSESIDASGDTLELEVRYPTRTRYQLPTALEVTITNTSGSALDQVSVLFEEAYIDQFSNTMFTPSVKEISDEMYEVELTNIPPGESRLVTVALQGNRYGKHDGTIAASANGAETVDVSVSTIIFP